MLPSRRERISQSKFNRKTVRRWLWIDRIEENDTRVLGIGRLAGNMVDATTQLEGAHDFGLDLVAQLALELARDLEPFVSQCVPRPVARNDKREDSNPAMRKLVLRAEGDSTMVG